VACYSIAQTARKVYIDDVDDLPIGQYHALMLEFLITHWS
jgi:hypothetical protein